MHTITSVLQGVTCNYHIDKMLPNPKALRSHNKPVWAQLAKLNMTVE